MVYILNVALFYLQPVAALAWFIVSLVMYLKTPKDSPKRTTRRVLLIVSTITFVVLFLLPVLFIALLYFSAISFM